MHAWHMRLLWQSLIRLHHKKIAGALIEYSGNFVVVGIGINVNSNPTVDKYKTTKLDNYSEIPMNVLLNRLMRNIDRWRSADFRQVRERWMSLATCLNMPVKYRGEIAELVGYSTSYYFSRIFKTYTGVSPNEFRKNNK